MRSEKPILRKVFLPYAMQPWVLHLVISVWASELQVGLCGEWEPLGKPRAGQPTGVHTGYLARVGWPRVSIKHEHTQEHEQDEQDKEHEQEHRQETHCV